jgi:transcriptional regulator with XRE-family HTH domain
VPARSQAHLALGRALREFRLERGYSQEALGFRSDLHRTYVAGIERGERNPTFESMSKVARALDIEPWQLMRRAEELDG